MMKILASAALIISVLTVSASKINNNSENFSNTIPLDTPAHLTLQIDSTDIADGMISPNPFEEKIIDLTDFASTLLGRKYVWGAVGPKTFDCSGFTSYVFRKQGIELHRTSRMQYTQGDKVDRSDMRAGDLIFFSSPRSGKGKVGHVGIVVSVDENNSITFIHASTKKGITYQKFPDNGYYSRNFIGAKRILEPESLS